MPSLPRTQVLVLEMIRGGGTVVFLCFFQGNFMTIDWAENIKSCPIAPLPSSLMMTNIVKKKTKKTLSGSELHNVTDIADISV